MLSLRQQEEDKMKSNYETADNRTQIIRKAYERNGMRGDKAISKETGIEYCKLHRRRMNNIGSLSMEEFWCLQRHACFTDEEILQIAKEG